MSQRLAPVSLLAAILLGLAVPSGGAEPAGLQRNFASPPLSARPAAYWAWLNGNTDRAQLTFELEEMKDKGLSGPQIFDVGAHDPDNVVPAGPAFMGPEWVKSLGHAVREAGRLGLEVGFITSSSWNAGGSWVTPEHASMGLFHTTTSVKGPVRFDRELPYPAIPSKAPKRSDGSPAYTKDVAVLAIPQTERVRRFEFVFELGPPGQATVDHAVLYNTPSDDPKRYGKQHLFAKDFQVLLSSTTREPDAWKAVVRGSLRPTTEAQRFDFEPAAARYVKLVITSGHNPKFPAIQLGEFELYSTDGRNVVCAYGQRGARTGARLLDYTAARGTQRDWTAGNIHDKARSGPGGSWGSGENPLGRVRNPADVVVLTDRIDHNGRLTWDVPAGKWIVLRFVCANLGQGLHVPSPNSQGLAIDHFSAAATAFHFQHLIDKLHKELGPLDKTALGYLYLCSYELRGQVWTPDMLKQFERRRGYDMTPFLPVLVGADVGTPETTARFRYDFDKTLGDLLADEFYATARRKCHEAGVKLCAEAGGPGPPLHNVPVDALKAQGRVDIPRGEFWNRFNIWVVKETACASHIYGKGIVDMEAFTSWRHWLDGPYELKPLADRALCEGTNHFTFHTSPHNPPQAGRPGWVYYAGTHIGPNRAWWPMARGFVDYLARCSYLLQQGLFVGDVCYYYGDQGYNFVPPKRVDPALGFGYDYDVTNAEVLLERMDVRDGRLVLPDGMSYALLVLPERDDMDWSVLQKLEKLVAAGATVVGRKPTRSGGLDGYPARNEQVRRLADKLWGPCDGKTVKQNTYDQGKIIWGAPLREILQSRGIGPDFQFAGRRKGTDLDFIHRRAGNTDIYFVSNKNPRWEEVACTFRVRGRAPELWSPDTGQIRSVAVYRCAEGGTRVPLRLPPHGSVFVVFRHPAPADHVVSLLHNGKPALSQNPDAPDAIPVAEVVPAEGDRVALLARANGEYVVQTADGAKAAVHVDSVPPPRHITGPWQVHFAKDLGAPPSKIFEQLHSWTDDPEPGVKWFSGVATYTKLFDLPAEAAADGRELLLDLGNVRFVAEVQLNGRPLGILWKPPFRVDATHAAQRGTNRLVVRVANVWSNRLAGDAQLPPQRRLTRTNMKYAETRRSPWKETPLQPSGLLGPVRLIDARRVEVTLTK